MVDIRLSAFSDEYAKDFEEQLAAMASFGIDTIELRFIDGENVSLLTREKRLAVKAALDRHGIKVCAIGSPLGKIRLDEDMDAHLALAKGVFETANLVGAKYIRIFSFYPPEGGDITLMKEEVIARLSRLLALAREYGVTLCHENEARIFGDIPERVRLLLDHFGGELQCVFDMGNYVLEGVEPYAAYELLKKDIAYFHIKDALYAGAIVPPGCGEAKIKDILFAHQQFTNNEFFVSLEPHLECFSGLNALVGRTFKNPYKYENEKAAFTDAVQKFKELIQK